MEPPYVGYLLKQVQQLLRATMDEALSVHSVTTPQFAALAAIERSGERSNAELARDCFVKPQTMIRIIANLEEAGFIRKIPDESHGRIVKILLTERGQRILGECHRVARQIDAGMLRGMRASERSALMQQLRRMADNLAGK